MENENEKDVKISGICDIEYKRWLISLSRRFRAKCKYVFERLPRIVRTIKRVENRTIINNYRKRMFAFFAFYGYGWIKVGSGCDGIEFVG